MLLKISETARKHKIDIHALLVFIVGSIFVAACLCILVVRLISVVEDSMYAQPTGGEAPGLYGIYRVWVGETVYQPLCEHPTAMVFNYLFYYTYGLSGRYLVSEVENLPVFLHLFTLVVTFGFIILFSCYIWRESKELAVNSKYRIIRAIVLLFPIIAFLGPFTGWWYLTARPDIIAVGLGLVALLFFLCMKDKLKNESVIFMTLIFWLAWSMKQTTVFVWLGVLVAMSMQRRWRSIFISIMVFIIFSLMPFFWFGKSYIEHTILTPLLNPLFLRQAIEIGKNALITGCYVYIPAVFLMVYYLRERREKDSALTVLIIVFIVTLIGNILTSQKEECWRNYYFSSFLVACLFIPQYLITDWHTADKMKQNTLLYVLISGFFLGLLLSSLYLIFPNQIGRIKLLTPNQREKTRRICQVIRSASRPVFIESSYFALPWNSGQHPSDVIEWTSYDRRRSPGLLEKRIGARYYAEAFVFEGKWAQLLERSGYKKTSRFGSITHFVRQ